MVRDITKLSGYPRSNVKEFLEGKYFFKIDLMLSWGELSHLENLGIPYKFPQITLTVEFSLVTACKSNTNGLSLHLRL